ncbi:MAG: ribosome small subunit-dependent GTPase A [Proteobacteria bacterium]|nr:MAG: ribosome small subunit-dependent GTPase A [Pseudomonadota bacterium]
MQQTSLVDWGLTPYFSEELKEGEILARVVEEQKTLYRVVSERGVLTAQLKGNLLHPSVDRLSRPVVGDWVVARPLWNEEKCVIQRVAARFSLLKRKAAGEDESIQPLAANVNCTFIVTSMNRDFNPKRLDRYLTIAFESGSRAAVLLTKSDLEPGSNGLALELAAKHNVPCLALSALSGEGLDPLRALLIPKETVVFVGSSGVGKSTLVNALLGREEQGTAAVREEDDRGRHTTTARRLIALSTGALVIDTPGLREIQLGADQDTGLEGAFAKIETLALGCRFTNCQHGTEPGCAVKAALKSGVVDAAQFESFKKLKLEVSGDAKKLEAKALGEQKRDWRSRARIAEGPKKKNR